MWQRARWAPGAGGVLLAPPALTQDVPSGQAHAAAGHQVEGCLGQAGQAGGVGICQQPCKSPQEEKGAINSHLPHRSEGPALARARLPGRGGALCPPRLPAFPGSLPSHPFGSSLPNTNFTFPPFPLGPTAPQS